MTAQTLVVLLGAAVPLPVAAIVKKYSKPWVKAVTNVVATALVAALAHLVTAGGHYDLEGFWRAYQAVLAASVVSYLALWKHTLVGTIEDATADWGLGTPVPPPPGEVALPPPPEGAVP